MSGFCERGIHNLRWIGDPEHHEETDTWWVMTECRKCGRQERVNVTGSHALQLWQFGKARDDLFRTLIEATGIERLVAWLSRKLDRRR